MARTPTIHQFKVELSHVDRSIYQPLELRVACHPSESPAYLITRVLAYCYFFEEGLAFSKGGLADPEEPALAIKGLDGAWQAWIEIGNPSAERLHKASKRCPRVAVVTHKTPKLLLDELATRSIHRQEALELYSLDGTLVRTLEPEVERSNRWDVTFSDEQLFVVVGAQTHSGTLQRLALSL
ncbi:MAG: YaeQ family protein [Pseudomonadota bacterium]